MKRLALLTLTAVGLTGALFAANCSVCPSCPSCPGCAGSGYVPPVDRAPPPPVNMQMVQMDSEMQSFYSVLTMGNQRRFVSLNPQEKMDVMMLTRDKGMNPNQAMDELRKTNRDLYYSKDGFNYSEQSNQMNPNAQGSNMYASGKAQMSSDIQDFYNSLSSDNQKKFDRLPPRVKNDMVMMSRNQSVNPNDAMDRASEQLQQMRNAQNGGPTYTSGFSYENANPYDNSSAMGMEEASDSDVRDFRNNLSDNNKKMFDQLSPRAQNDVVVMGKYKNMSANDAMDKMMSKTKQASDSDLQDFRNNLSDSNKKVFDMLPPRAQSDVVMMSKYKNMSANDAMDAVKGKMRDMMSRQDYQGNPSNP